MPVALAALAVGAVLQACGGAASFAAPSAATSSAGAGFGLRGPGRVARGAGAGAAVLLQPTMEAVAEPPSSGMVFASIAGIIGAISGGVGYAAGVQAASQAAVGLAGLYVIMSVNEYVVHRYYQHIGINKTALFRWMKKTFKLSPLKSSGHVEHHKETKDDMSLDRRQDPILDSDLYRGTAFSWSISGIMTFEIAIQSYPWLWLCGWSFQASTIALFAGIFLHAAIWQTLHPHMHDLPDPRLVDGVPGWSMAALRSTGFFRYLHHNHEGHHRAFGAHGNYNVCCPLADHMFGTYVGIIPPKAQLA